MICGHCDKIPVGVCSCLVGDSVGMVNILRGIISKI